MKTFFLRATLAVLLTTEPAWAIARPAPRAALIVTIVVDQFSANLFNQYRSRFRFGLRTLSDDGLVYANAYQQHAETATCPGHATILTGRNPAAIGIPANSWRNPTTAQEVYCLGAPANRLSHAGRGQNGPVGPDNLGVTTLGDWMKAADPASRVYAVSGKDRGAIALAGHRADGTYWYVEGFGFTTYLRPGDTAAARLAPVRGTNDRLAARKATTPPRWDYSDPTCRLLAGTWNIGGKPWSTTMPPTDLSFAASPMLDEATLDAARDLIVGQRLGRGSRPDLLGISLSATDTVGHRYGTQGPEMCEQMHRLDAALGTFLTELEKIPGEVIVVLTADHGGSDFAERSAARGYATIRHGDTTVQARINAALRKRFALAGDPLIFGPGNAIYVVPFARVRVAEIAAAAAALLRAEPTVAGAFTSAALAALPMPAADAAPNELTLAQRERLSFVADRSGDVTVAFKPDVVPGAVDPGKPSSGHGTPWDYDRRVPVLVWSPGWYGEERFLPIRTIDIAPSLAALLNVPVRVPLDGVALWGPETATPNSTARAWR